jgi:hypothetical protein
VRSLLYPSLEDFDPCDIAGGCVGDGCYWYPCIRSECADHERDDDCDDSCDECPESGPLPGCLR